MPYTPYLTADEYEGSTILPKDIDLYLLKASHHIDALTFNRIVGNFNKLTEFQQSIIKEVCSKLAEFEYENAEMLESVLKSYSINGVSVEFGGVGIRYVSGIPIPNDLYQLLSQTGLCSRVIR